MWCWRTSLSVSTSTCNVEPLQSCGWWWYSCHCSVLPSSLHEELSMLFVLWQSCDLKVNPPTSLSCSFLSLPYLLPLSISTIPSPSPSPPPSPFFLYPEPINIFHGVYKNDNSPIRLSYHGNVHYNSVVDPYEPSVGVGLGLAGYKPGVSAAVALCGWDATVCGWDTTVCGWDTTDCGWDVTVCDWDATVCGWDATVCGWDATVCGWDAIVCG